uniref:Uncharacterized protein n=1 Tax=Tanacetum cinerariifolium TaxID=118510 RepID=A0A699HD06_TANCI|nr:hypothetical protein [Tanacetum cinerariifolium]
MWLNACFLKLRCLPKYSCLISTEINQRLLLDMALVRAALSEVQHSVSKSKVWRAMISIGKLRLKNIIHLST